MNEAGLDVIDDRPFVLRLSKHEMLFSATCQV